MTIKNKKLILQSNTNDMKTLLFTVTQELHDKLAKQAASLRKFRPDFYAMVMELGSIEVQKNIDAGELHELSVELAHNILLNVDPHRSEGNHKFDIEFKFKGNSAFANGDVEFEYYKNNLVHVSTTFEMDMFDKDGEDVEFNMPDDNEVAELIKIFC